MPDCATLPVAVEVCTPEWAAVESLRMHEWQGRLVVSVDPVRVDTSMCDDAMARASSCERELDAIEARTDACEGQLVSTAGLLRSSQQTVQAMRVELQRCLIGQQQPADPAGAWVLGALAVGAVAMRWIR